MLNFFVKIIHIVGNSLWKKNFVKMRFFTKHHNGVKMKNLYGRTRRVLKKQRPTVFDATVGPAHTLNMVGKP
jgi:hypothetical protein